MTKTHKIRVLLAILECSPAAHGMTEFESAARRGDLSSFWDHYQTALGRSTDAGPRSVEAGGAITLDMLKPAMNAVYKLPTSD